MNWLKLVIALVSMLAALPAPAQDYPTRPITLIVPLGAGGVMDVISRVLGQKLSERFGKPVVIENRTGGGTVTAAVAVAKAAPDGHTLLNAPSGTLATNVTLFKTLPYDPQKDYVPIALYAKIPFVLSVNPSLPVHSIADLARLTKERPMSYGSTGTGTVQHLAGELLKHRLGIEMTHVPYRGVMQSLTDLAAGHVQVAFASPDSGMALIKDGKVRPIGVSTLTRLAVLPDVPTLAEAGVPDFEAVSWHLIVAPAATPPEIVGKLHTEIKRIMAAPEIARQIADMGLIPIDTPSVEELRGFVRTEIGRWGALVRQAGIAGSH
jgi:tripartite-type tricarboxylate transporter receptor subunit TctC